MKAVNILMMGGVKKKSINGASYLGTTVNTESFLPTDWIIPSQSHIIVLGNYLGGGLVAGGKMKEAGTTHWNSPNTGADNSSGFTAFGTFGGIYGLWWTTTESYQGPLQQVCFSLEYDDTILLSTDDPSTNIIYVASDYALIRLIYAGSGTPASIIYDNEGRPYDVIQIGTQYWTKQNLATLHSNTGSLLPNVTYLD